MNIGIDIKAFKNGTTGIARYLSSLMDQLQKLDTKNQYFLFECTPSKYVVTNPRWKKILIPWRLPGIFWQQFILPRHLLRYHIDILWAPEQICPLPYKGTIFTTVHDLTALRFPGSCQWPNLIIQKYLFPLTIRRSALLMPVSDFVGRELLSLYPGLACADRMATISNGSPERDLRHEVRAMTGKPVLFFAGNREPRKNLIRLVEALEILYKEGMEIELRLAGPAGWKNRLLHRRIENSPLCKSIRFLGYLSEERLMEQYRTCSAFVYPSVYEGFGLPVLEAFSMGCRVITSRGTVMEEIAGEAARYFDPFDAADMARVIRSALNESPPGYEEFSLYKKVLEKYSWERSARELLRLFDSKGPGCTDGGSMAVDSLIPGQNKKERFLSVEVHNE